MFPRAAAIIVLGLIAYGSMVSSPFKTMDDRVSIVDNSIIKSVINIPQIFREGYFHDQSYYRPLVNLSFMGEYHAFGLNPFFYNLDNLILHLLNAVLVFFLVSRLANNEAIGFWTALLFVIHPVQWEAVCNISGRAILMSAFFALSSFIVFLEFYKRRRWVYLPIIFVLFSLGLLCKESAAVLPAVVLVFMLLDRNTPWFERIKFLGPFLIGIAGYCLWRHVIGMTNIYHAGDPLGLVLGFVTFLRSVMTDLRLFVLPVDLHFDRCLPFFMSLTYPPAILALVFWSIILIALYLSRRFISPFIFFLMAWFAIELLPVSQLVSGIGVGTGYVSTAEHFLYLACIPVFIGMVMLFCWAYEFNTRHGFVSPSLLKWMAGVFLSFLLITAIEQSIYASNEFTMLDRSLAYEPNNPRLQAAMGRLSLLRDDLPDAEKRFRAAIKAEPMNASYHISLGSALCQEGRWVEALAQYVAFDPGKDKDLVGRQEKLCIMHIRQELKQGKDYDGRQWLAIGDYYALNNQTLQAIGAFLKSVSVNPGQSDAWMNLGSLYEVEKNWPAARLAYKNLLRIRDANDFQKEFAVNHLRIIGKQ